MITNDILRIGDVSDNGQVTVVDEDRLCYIVRSESKGAVGLRTISKALLSEYVQFYLQQPDANANLAREKLCGKTDIDKFEYGYTSTLSVLAKMVLNLRTSRTQISGYSQEDTKQIIYYGAPGTGKSYAIAKATEGKEVIRTTFHPDSDYSTFVGAYKPSTKETPMRDVTGKIIIENGKQVTENRIVYEFVSQAFLQAYVGAWKKFATNSDEPQAQYLVIEEINRGNCAQIFGDLFQLLDRNANGFSEYPIKADSDMKKHLQKLLSGLTIENADSINSLYEEKDVVKQVLNGDILLLPSNLYIWATMNTSDQSLFPIDSAFKRRWDWEYIPIQYEPKDKNGKDISFKIEIDGSIYDWGKFIKAINERIFNLTHSEDKQLGYFFVKPDKSKDVITIKRFVSKVVFYLWSDIYKDYAGRDNSIFKFSKDGDEKNRQDYSFNSFFDEKDIKVSLVKNFIEQFVKATEDDSEIATDARYKYSINGGKAVGGRKIAFEVMKQFVAKFNNLTPDAVIDEWNQLGIKITHFVETEQEYNNRKDKSLRAEPVECGNGEKVYVSTHGWVYNTNENYKVSTIKQLIKAVQAKDWKITIDIIEP